MTVDIFSYCGSQGSNLSCQVLYLLSHLRPGFFFWGGCWDGTPGPYTCQASTLQLSNNSPSPQISEATKDGTMRDGIGGFPSLILELRVFESPPHLAASWREP